MRPAFVLAFVVAACSTTANDATLSNGSGDGTGGGSGGIEGPAAECAADSDCVLAAARCCDCPTFAMPVDPATDICAGVTCPMPGPSCPANIHAACEQAQCAIACDIAACDQQCSDGFMIDSNGCATCSCFAVSDRTCTASSDCAEVPADCCGCALGGSDTAVPTGDVASWEAGLDCPPSPSCPGVTTCDPGASPSCVQGACALAPALPANACGRPDLAPCAAGMVCALNADPQATAQGVGICVPAS
jgi:hypothetical protein